MVLPPASAERHLLQGLIQLANGGLKARMGRENAARRIAALRSRNSTRRRAGRGRAAGGLPAGAGEADGTGPRGGGSDEESGAGTYRVRGVQNNAKSRQIGNCLP